MGAVPRVGERGGAGKLKGERKGSSVSIRGVRGDSAWAWSNATSNAERMGNECTEPSALNRGFITTKAQSRIVKYFSRSYCKQ